MTCLGLEPGAAEWKAQTNPLSYGGTLKKIRYFVVQPIFNAPKKNYIFETQI